MMIHSSNGSSRGHVVNIRGWTHNVTVPAVQYNPLGTNRVVHKPRSTASFYPITLIHFANGNNSKGGYPRESNCRQFGARNCREKVLTRFHVRVKYVDSHCQQVFDS